MHVMHWELLRRPVEKRTLINYNKLTVRRIKKRLCGKVKNMKNSYYYTGRSRSHDLIILIIINLNNIYLNLNYNIDCSDYNHCNAVNCNCKAKGGYLRRSNLVSTLDCSVPHHRSTMYRYSTCHWCDHRSTCAMQGWIQ